MKTTDDGHGRSLCRSQGSVIKYVQKFQGTYYISICKYEFQLQGLFVNLHILKSIHYTSPDSSSNAYLFMIMNHKMSVFQKILGIFQEYGHKNTFRDSYPEVLTLDY